MSAQVKRPALQVGDAVRFARAFLQSTYQTSRYWTGARGRVVDLQPVSRAVFVVVVQWDRPDLPTRVLNSNLEKVKK